MLASAMANVGSSNFRPLMNTTSASLKRAATDGAGSKVCELVPSGTMPRTSTQSPPTRDTMEVIGETVVATRIESPSASAAESSDPPHPDSTRAAAEALARTSGNGRMPGVYGELHVLAKDLH